VGVPEPGAKFLYSIKTGQLIEAVKTVLAADKTARLPLP
jgi:hypothetical protein